MANSWGSSWGASWGSSWGVTNVALDIDAGSYAVTGQDVTLTKSGAFSILIEAGSYLVTGQDVTLTQQWAIVADAGSYAITGQDVTLQEGQAIVIDGGSYAITGQDVTFVKTWIMDVEAGSYLVSGQNVGLELSSAAGAGAAQDPGFWTDEWRKIKEREERKAEKVGAPVTPLSQIPEFIPPPVVDDDDEIAELLEMLSMVDTHDIRLS